MASTSKGKKGAARGLNSLEISIHKKALSCPKQIAQQEDIDAIDGPREARVAALNFLLETGYMKLMRFDGTNKLAYKAVRVKEAQNMGLLGDDVQMVLARIEVAGNEGIWTKTIQRATELPQTVVNKCIKTLESQAIIKNIKAVKTPTRKMYMMAYLEPSVEVTGGPWYTDSEFDSAFVSILLDQFYNYIAARSLPEPTPKCARPLFAPDMGHRYPTATDITQWVKRTQLSSVDLTQGHVETLLKVLEYDGRVERLPASAAAMFASALNARKRENANAPDRKKARKRKRYSDDDSDEDRERKRRKKSKRRDATMSSDMESSPDERSVMSRSRGKRDEKGRSKSRRNSDLEISDSEDDWKDRRRKRRKRGSSSDEESTDDRRSKRRRAYSKSNKHRSEGSEPESDDDTSHAHSRGSKKSDSRSTHSHSRSESPRLVEMDAIEAYVYRAIRPQVHNQAASACLSKGREMGVEDMAWAQAPCVKCPQAEFCKEGGPVNASLCEYFPEWMDPVGFGRVPYVDEDFKVALIGDELEVKVDMVP